MKNLLTIILLSFYLSSPAQNLQLIGNFFSIAGVPLENVHVTCENNAVGYTDPNGRLTMSGKFENGRKYNFTATKAGFKQIVFDKQVNDFTNLGNYWLCPDNLDCSRLGILVIKNIEENIKMYLNGESGRIINRPQFFIDFQKEDIGNKYIFTFEAKEYCQKTVELNFTGNDVIRVNLTKKCKLNIITNSHELDRKDRNNIEDFLEKSRNISDDNKFYMEFAQLHTNVLKITNFKDYFPRLYYIIQGIWYEYSDYYNTATSIKEYNLAYEKCCKNISKIEIELLKIIISNPKTELIEWLSKKTGKQCN